MAFDIDKYFRVMRFLKDNPTIVSICRRDQKVFKGKLPYCPEHGTSVDHISLQKYMSDESITNPNRIDLLVKLLEWDPINSLSLPKEFTVANTALESRDKIRRFFGQVLVPGSFAYNTQDIDKFRQFLVDWSSSFKTFKDLMIHSSDVFTLDDIDIDKAIRGFGIDFVNKKTVPNLITRQVFLLALTNLYKIKGSPNSVVDALSLVGLSNCIIKEYWIERLPNSYKNLQIRGIAANKWKQKLVNNRYEWEENHSLYDDTLLSWENFGNRLIEIKEPHWWYAKDEIINIEWNNDVWMKLPSITPYFGLEYYPDIEKYNIVISLIEKILSYQFNAYLQGRQDLIPKDIGVDGYNENLSERDVWIDGYNEPLTLLETFLGWVYSQIRYDEYLQYTHFKNFLISKHVNVENENYSYPWAYQELIYSIYKRIENNELIEGVIPLATIVKSYPKKATNYYCSTNELISWWLNKSDENDHTVDNIPSIFFDSEYPFKYQILPENTENDKILYYNGPRNIDFYSSDFKYSEIMKDLNFSLYRNTYRKEYDNNPKSYHASNRENEYLVTNYDAIYNHNQTYYEYISHVAENYFETEEHDGSKLTPIYLSKYPEPRQWNWAVDSDYFYYCKSPTKWVRTKIELSWDDNSTIRPNSKPPKTNPGEPILGYHIYNDGYVYIYASMNQWIRYKSNNNWNYHESPITDAGLLKLKSDIAKINIKAKVSPSIAYNWIHDRLRLVTISFEFILDPLGKEPSSYQYTASELTKYIEDNRLVIDENGYIFTDFNRFVHNDYLYLRMLDQDQNVIWTRCRIETDWNNNGNKIYQGDYKFPNLDLTNRYDADRILRGKFVLQLTDLEGLDGNTNNGEILVSNGSSGYPEVWIYDEPTSCWVKSPINKIANIPGKNNIKQINLGFNDKFINWMDNSSTDDSNYGVLADSCLTSFSNYIRNAFNDMDIDVATIFKKFKNGGVYRDIIQFFKPKRVRLFYLSMNLIFDDRLFNSIKLYDEPESTKLIQQINDYVPRQDLIFIQNNNGLYKKSYHQDDRVDVFEIPTNSVYGDAVLYLTGFEDDRVNGFYFLREDLKQDSSLYFLNDKNICLTLIKNSLIKIHNQSHQWIIAYRKNNLDFDDALYVCYDNDYINGAWYTKNEIPEGLNNRKVINVEDLTIDNIERQFSKSNITFDRYDLDLENRWNCLYPRKEPSPVGTENEIHVKTNRIETSSLRHWGPVLCKDLYNIRTVFPSGQLGHPENLTGSRVSGYDYLNNPGDPISNQEEPHSFIYWPYQDDIKYQKNNFKIKENCEPIIQKIIKQGTNYLSTSDCNYYIEKKIFLGEADGVCDIFKLDILRLNSNSIKIYINETELVKNLHWKIIENETEILIKINFIPDQYSKLYYSYPVPIWWIFSTFKFKSGPINHRPIYIGIESKIYDKYPCRNISQCCDYFDIGCDFDGPTNENICRYEDKWIGGQYKEYDIHKLNYDEHTQHHRKFGYITNLNDIWNPKADISKQRTVRFHWEHEKEWTNTLYNYGDTYCTKCDVPLFAPDISVYSLPKEYLDCGVFHDYIFSSNFNNIDFNNKIWRASPITKNSQWDFPLGYISKDGYELVHVYHKPSGYHYWEIRHLNNNQIVCLLRSEIKEKRHDLNDAFININGNWQVNSDNFLNGHDLDVANDRWTLIDESENFITTKQISKPFSHGIIIGKDKSEITQTLTNGSFITSIPFDITIDDIENEDTEFFDNIKENQVRFEIVDDNHGILSICLFSNQDLNMISWKKLSLSYQLNFPILNNIPQILEGYIYKDRYLYLDSQVDEIGWIQIHIDKIFVDDIFQEDIISGSKYQFYFSLQNIDANLEETEICANIIPFSETYNGVKLIHNKDICQCTVYDELDINQFAYCVDPQGDFIKIKTDNSHSPEIRFVPKEYQSILSKGFDSLSISSIEYYYLNRYIPFFLIDDLTQSIVKWKRVNNLYYTKNEIDGYIVNPCNYYYYYYNTNSDWSSDKFEIFE